MGMTPTASVAALEKVSTGDPVQVTYTPWLTRVGVPQKLHQLERQSESLTVTVQAKRLFVR